MSSVSYRVLCLWSIEHFKFRNILFLSIIHNVNGFCQVSPSEIYTASLNVNTDINLEKSVDPRKTQKARKDSKKYQAQDRYPKGGWLCNTIV
jgi:hypothetical protein